VDCRRISGPRDALRANHRARLRRTSGRRCTRAYRFEPAGRSLTGPIRHRICRASLRLLHTPGRSLHFQVSTR
jgi:hypothetical protein